MNRYLRYVLTIFCAVTILLLGLIAYITIIFDANAYKMQIAQLVKDRIQRNLRLKGDIKLIFFPGIGLITDRLELSEYRNEEEFAAAEHVRVSLKLLPLLQKQLILDEIVITGLRARLIRFSDGHTNIDDLIAKREEPGQFKPDIGRVRLEKTSFSFRDETSGMHFLLKDLNLEADRTASPSGSGDSVAWNKVNLGFRVHEPEQPDIDLVAQLTFHLTVDKEEQHYGLKNLNLQGEARAPGIPRLAIRSTGDFSANLARGPGKGEFVANGVTARIDAVMGQRDERDKAGMEKGVDIRLEMPRLSLSDEKLASDRMIADMTISQPYSRITGHLSLSDISGTIAKLTANALTAELEAQRNDFIFKTTITSPLTGNVTARQFSLPRVKGVISIINAGVSEDTIDGHLTGSASVDGLSQDENVRASLEGKLAGSNITTKLSAAGTAPRQWIFTADIDQLNLDQLLPTLRAEKFSSQSASDAIRQPLDLSLLDSLGNLNFSGSVHIGILEMAGIHTSGVNLDIRPD